MDFRLLGPLEVADQERALALGGVKQRSLLALLPLHANEVVAAERLIGGLSGEQGLGAIRGRLASSPPAPTVPVCRGPRPGGLALDGTRAGFGWSLTGAGT